MALARAVVLKDATATAVSSGANGTAYDLSAIIASGRKLYAGLHVTTQSTDSLQVLVQSATSSGFTAATTEFIFSARTSRGAEWATSGGTTIGSTDRIFWRCRWTLSTGSNAPTAKMLPWVGIQ
jgi:hypothetical protein